MTRFIYCQFVSLPPKLPSFPYLFNVSNYYIFQARQSPTYPWPSLLPSQALTFFILPSRGSAGGQALLRLWLLHGGPTPPLDPTSSTRSPLLKAPFALRAPLHPGAAPGLPEARSSTHPRFLPNTPRVRPLAWGVTLGGCGGTSEGYCPRASPSNF